ncbi:MAG: hypothetical protein GXY07_05410 [Candidatus Hydrogenedentes bacterium]|nr:hypothetical protein [Candidatus Hydrogenedentota bacterium]
MKKKYICFVLGLSGFFLGFIVVLVAMGLVTFLLEEYTDADYPFWPLIVAPWLALAAGILLGLFISRWHSQSAGITWHFGRKTKIAALIFVVLYLVTWAAGAPMVQSMNTQRALEQWREIHQEENTLLSSINLPHIETFAAAPIVPFVVASYYEYHLARLCGAGGWDIQIWYLVGTKRLLFFDIWRS